MVMDMNRPDPRLRADDPRTARPTGAPAPGRASSRTCADPLGAAEADGGGRRGPAFRDRAGFWLVAAAFMVTMAFATVPTPLYPLYERRDGFGPLMVTVVFAAYGVGVLAALFLAGHLSDWYGRKRLLVPALVLSIGSALLFAGSAAVPALITARVLSGLSVGVVTATATAHLTDLDRRIRSGTARSRAEVVATAANLGGLAIGPPVAGLIAEHTGTPLRLPYVVFAGLLVFGTAAALLAPETVDPPEPRPRYRPQRTAVPRRARRAFVAAALAALATFAVFGMFTSLAPVMLADQRVTSMVVSGLTAFLVFASAATAQILLGRLRAGAQLPLGLALLAAGLVALTLAVWTADLPLFVAGGVVAGAGSGLAFKGGIATVIEVAEPHRRGETLAGLFLAAYLGPTVPVVGLGVAAQTMPMPAAVLVFTGVLLAVIALAAYRSRAVRTAG